MVARGIKFALREINKELRRKTIRQVPYQFKPSIQSPEVKYKVKPIDALTRKF